MPFVWLCSARKYIKLIGSFANIVMQNHDPSNWETLRLQQLRNDKIQKINEEVRAYEQFQEDNRDRFRTESIKLKMECSQTPDPADRWAYRKGLRLMYLGTMLEDSDLKTLGKEFCDKCK